MKFLLLESLRYVAEGEATNRYRYGNGNDIILADFLLDIDREPVVGGNGNDTEDNAIVNRRGWYWYREAAC